MRRRTTINLDQDLLATAQRVLGEPTTRGTVESALRKVVELAEDATERRVSAQRRYLEGLSTSVDLDVLTSEDMWR